MHVLNEMHRLLRDRIVLAMPLFCRATVPWEPGSRDHPTIGCSHSLSFAPVSPWATGTDKLPWHHFRICCRGIIFGYVAVAPFSLSLPWHPFRSTTATNASFQHAHVNVFLKLHKLAYVIRIMITTFKMFKIVVCLKLLNDIWGFFGIVVCCFRPHLNLPK